MSEEKDVLSQVSLRTTGINIIFVIMISDIEKEVKESIVRYFAGDTIVSKIRSENGLYICTGREELDGIQ